MSRRSRPTLTGRRLFAAASKVALCLVVVSSSIAVARWVHSLGPDGAAAQAPVEATSASSRDVTSSRFEAIDVFVDAGESSLAAWQVEITSRGAKTYVTGVEGGEHQAFAEPAYYDRKAEERSGRVVLAKFSTDDRLPTGKTRVARVHLMVEGEGAVEYRARLVVAGDAKGKKIDAKSSVAIAKENG